MTPSFKLGIDWGEKSLGVALCQIDGNKNIPIYTSTLVAEEKWLKEKISRRNAEKRLRRTRKSKEKRLKILKNTLKSLALDSNLERFILSFCKRRGFDHTDIEETERRNDGEAQENRYSHHRTVILEALSKELANQAPTRSQEILDTLEPLLNRQMRPKRFLNRNTSKCQWHGCTKNVPKKVNSREETLILELYPKLHPFLTINDTKAENFKDIEALIETFIKAAVKLSATGKSIPDETKNKVSNLCKEFRKDVLGLVKDKERFRTIWTRGRMRENLKNIVLGSPAGRQTFCREHVNSFKDFLLDGRVIPKREDITESDLTRGQEIIFSKLFAFVRGRLLPLTRGRGISEITVERNAFDVVPRELRPHMENGKKKGLSEDKLSDLYWYGPMYERNSEREMFFKEFDGKCAYCYASVNKNSYHIEHIFNKADFPMDGYLNKIPSCEACNRRKGNKTALEARMPIHADAYSAYETYLKKRSSEKKVPPHFLMNTKKGILNLLKGSNGGFWAEQPESRFGSFTEERLIRLMGRDLVSQARTQSSPRMLARYLATKLEVLTEKRPETQSFNSRYVAQIRGIFCPEFYKDIEKEHGHALDAAILSCRWPNPNTPIRGNDGKEHWDFNIYWKKELQQVWPENIKEDGTIELPNIRPVQGFEKPLEKGGFYINLSSTNWNPREISVADQTIYSIKNGKPSVRKPARDYLKKLLEVEDPIKHIETIVHPNLKAVLLETFKKTNSKKEVEKVFKGWLRKTTKAGLKGFRPPHPSSQARWKELEKFVKGAEEIPPTISLRCVQKEGIEESPDIKRLRDGHLIHAQRSQPSYRCFIVAYKRDNPDKQKPLVLGVKQSWRVEPVYGPQQRIDNIIENKTHLKNGRPYRHMEKEKDFLIKWREDLSGLFEELGHRLYHRVKQGNIILYEDGKHLQIKNFKKGESISRETFCNIKKVYPSPYNFLLKNTP